MLCVSIATFRSICPQMEEWKNAYIYILAKGRAYMYWSLELSAANNHWHKFDDSVKKQQQQTAIYFCG